MFITRRIDFPMREITEIWIKMWVVEEIRSLILGISVRPFFIYAGRDVD